MNRKISKGYTTLREPQPVGTPTNKIEVLEFFHFGCGPCYEFFPYIEAWEKEQRKDVVFTRVPDVFVDDHIPYAKMYHALVALDVAGQLMPEVFRKELSDQGCLLTPQAQADFFATLGIDKEKYMDEYNSVAALKEVERDITLYRQYEEISGIPTLVVQGKYLTGPGHADGFEESIEVVNFLVQQIREKNM